ncbi:MAG TPA: AsmA-like C-terminal region-containing protein, partial [Bacteroidales bacterium]|nr:AsmA-like C-terminal region-containing protein [Bacteroidales bacterium]
AIETPSDTTAMSMEVNLKEFRINNGRIRYTDEDLNMIADIRNLNLLLSGNFSENYTDLDLTTDAQSLTVDYDGVKYINNAPVSINSMIGADLENYKFTLDENEVKINDLTLGVKGFFGMPSDSVYTVDMKYFTKNTDFKELLSMIPAVYMTDFNGLKATGKLRLEGTVKGTVTETAMPEITMDLVVNDGHFSYPDLPKSADNIQMNLRLYYDGVVEDNTTVDLDRFHIEIAGNPVDMNFHVITPFSDPQMNGAVKGELDLASVADVIPLDSMNLTGVITANIRMMGKMSDIENENYEAFQADGDLSVTGMEVSGGDIPEPVRIEKSKLVFSPELVNLETFDAAVGISDIHMDGRLENFIPYLFKDETIRGSLNMSSQLLDLNSLMASDEDDAQTSEADTVSLTVFEVPANVDLTLKAELNKVNYDKLEIANLRGEVTVKDAVMKMNNLSMELLGGDMNMNGEYNTQEVTTPLIDLDMDMNNIDFPSAFYAFNTVEKLAPVAKMCRGRFSTKLQFSSRLDTFMNPVLNSINGIGVLKTDQVEIINNKTLDKVADALKNDKFRNPTFNNINLSFTIRDGRVYVDPFETSVGSTDVTVAGDQGLDQTLNYLLTFSIPRNEFGSSANDLLENLASQARSKGFDINPGEDVNISVKITGTFTDPKIGLSLKQNIQKAREEIKKAVEERVKEEVNKVKEDVKKDVSAEIDKIMKDAQEQADQIKKSADDAGESLIGEAQLRKKQLVKEAGSNPIKKIAAEKTGDELVKQARQKAEKLKQQADKNAEAIMEKARQKAGDLKNK